MGRLKMDEDKRNDTEEAPKRYCVPAVIKTLDIFEHIADVGAVSLAELSRALSLPKTSVYQILNTLTDRGYLHFSAESGQYSLSLRLYGLGGQALIHLDLRDVAQPLLHQLMLATNQTCHLGVLEQFEAVYVAKAHCPGSPVIHSWVGKRFSLQTTAMGKVLLAWRSPEEALHLLRGMPPQRVTKNTITDPEEFVRRLAQVRERGWALDNEENVPGICCVAAPVFGPSGEVVAAVSLSGPSLELSPEMYPALAAEVCRTAQAVAEGTGCGRREHAAGNGR